MSGTLLERVGELLREAAAEAIVPRFRALSDADVEEKSPGELVTVADREAETIISRGLLRLRPGSRVVGEEACAAEPALLDRLDEGTVWLVDPLDGTGNFASGRAPFAVMTALVVGGETVAAWLLNPLTGELAVAERGAGAYLGGERVTTDQSSPGIAGLKGAALSRFMPADVHEAIAARAAALGEVLPNRICAGADYPAVARGERHFTLYWRMLPWDHAAGSLFLTEAGGYAARTDGSIYQPAMRGTGLLVAHNRAIWEDAKATLLG